MSTMEIKKLSIGILCHSGVGGSSKIAADLAKNLCDRDYTVHFFSLYQPFLRVQSQKNLIVHTLYPKWYKYPGQLYSNWSYMESKMFIELVSTAVFKYNIKILHFHYALPFALLAKEIKSRCSCLKLCTIGTFHGTDVSFYPDKNTHYDLIKNLHDADYLTTVSHYYAQWAFKKFDLRKTPEVLPNFIDINRFCPSKKLPFERQKHRRIIHVSNFRLVKNVMSVIRVFIYLKKKLDVELWLIGEGETMPLVRTMVKKASLENYVYWFGLQHHVENFLQQTDLLLMTSWEESFCMAALEAMGCGLPVVATHVGGLPELVLEDITGFLFKVGDEIKMAEKIFKLFTHSELYSRLSNSAIKEAKKFSENKIIYQYEQIYQKLGSKYDK